jgi:uncharacterized protein
MNNTTRMVMILAAVSVAGCEMTTPVDSPDSRAHVMVQGEARLEVVPDELNVRLTVEATDEDMSAASDSVTRRINAALDAIRAAGVEDADLRALTVQISPVYDWVERTQVFRGHRVSRSVEFKLRALEPWPELVEALVAARVDRIDSVTPGRSDAEQLRRGALRDAVADAEDRARVLAEAAGATLGRAWMVTEQGRGYAAPRMESAMLRNDDAGAAQWEAGTITITASVQATFLMD